MAFVWRAVTKPRLGRDFAALVESNGCVASCIPELDPHVKCRATPTMQQHHPRAGFARLQPSRETDVAENAGRFLFLVGRPAEEDRLETARFGRGTGCNTKCSTKINWASLDNRWYAWEWDGNGHCCCHCRWTDRRPTDPSVTDGGAGAAHSGCVYPCIAPHAAVCVRRDACGARAAVRVWRGLLAGSYSILYCTV